MKYLILLLMTANMAYAAGDAERGKALYQAQCMACHSMDISMAGPAHRGVVGRRVGRVADFSYSPALQKSRLVWTEKNLDLWLRNPEKLIAGQRMGYSVADAQQRQDLIAYLKTQR